ncbi:MAG: hypothetical protein OEZ59_00440 [Deltaproteobacteria bacterium]|nr:hypothetical protein [Deltaproteobacteria bacterium]
MSEMVKELEILEGLVELVSDSMKSAIQNAQNDQAETTNDAGEELKDSAA